ncbi:MAG TPA: cell division protein SepF [Firmicutes bacterium]|nr:cell division protein SepF [Bacillota bacterium]
MGERFLDKVLHFMGIRNDEEEEEEVAAAAEEKEPVKSRSGLDEETPSPRSGRLVSFPPRESTTRRHQTTAGPVTRTTADHLQARWRISILEPVRFEDVQEICDHLKQRRPVLISVEGVDKELSKRIIDFVSGTTYAIDGQVQRVSEGIFLFAPPNVAIDADLQHNWEEDEL